MKSLAYWWLFFWLQVIGYATAGYFGWLQQTWSADASKLSFVIIALHAFTTVLVGRQIAKVRRGELIDIDHGHFLASTCGKLGMLGTIVGFIYMVTGALGGLTTPDISTEQLRAMMGALDTGIGTALWTTLWGLVAALLIEVQIHILERTKPDEA